MMSWIDCNKKTIFTYQDYNFSRSINIVFGSDCHLESGVCGEIKTFVRSTRDSTHNSDEMDSKRIYSDNKNDNVSAMGDDMNRDELYYQVLITWSVVQMNQI